MREERRTILSLVATGRVTPAEAERLLAVTTEGREERWMVAACLAAGVSQIHLNAVLPVLHSGLLTLTQLLGGRS
jgi:hypothetical protein